MEEHFEDEDGVVEYVIDLEFEIDDGELDKVSRQQSFMLGFEFAMFMNTLVNHPPPFTATVHEQNVDRIMKSINDYAAGGAGRAAVAIQASVQPVSDGWKRIVVRPTII